jgi:hypothetical protein
VYLTRSWNATYYRVLFIKSPVIGALEIFDLGSGTLSEATDSIDAIVAISRDDKATTVTKRKAFANDFECGCSIGGEYADVVLSGSIKVF